MELLYNWIDEHEDTLLSWQIPVVMSGLYLSGIFMLKKWKERQLVQQPKIKGTTQQDGPAAPRQRKPLSEDPIRVCMAAHNLFLFILSLAMAVMTIYEAFIVRLPEVGGNALFCSKDRNIYNKGLFFWSVIFYFSKYYEYLDTVFIILNNRPLIFLHVWHHLSIAFLTLAFLNNHITFLFSGVLINSGIHTAMYWSYYQTCLGKDVWWKRYLTQMQMVQFAWGIGSWMTWPFVCGWDPVAVACIALDLAILSSFFYLFKAFYNVRYTKPTTSIESKSAAVPKKESIEHGPASVDSEKLIVENEERPRSVEEKNK